MPVHFMVGALGFLLEWLDSMLAFDALLSAIHGATVVNTLYQDGLGASTFHAFSPLQPEETYSMVPANRF